MRTFVIFLIKIYRKLNDGLVMMGFPPSSCRFDPTCSNYFEQAVRKYGALRGTGMGVRRLGRCHPFFEGGYDPVK